MKRVLVATVAVLTAACAATAHEGADAQRDVVTDYDFAGFDRIEVSGVHTLDIRAGNRFSVRTEATKDSARWSEVRLEGDTLVLGKDKDHRNRDRYDGNHDHGVKAIVTMPRLTFLDVSGVTNGSVAAFTGGDVEIDASGVTNLTLSGSCDSLEIDASGVADIEAEALKCADVEADASGVSKLEVFASRRIEADSSGMSKIGVHGSPGDRDIEESMTAKVKFR